MWIGSSVLPDVSFPPHAARAAQRNRITNRILFPFLMLSFEYLFDSHSKGFCNLEGQW